MEKKHLVFVYGTLRQNHSNHHLMRDAYFYGIGRTCDKYTMYIKAGYPFVTSIEASYPITGELYAVDDDTLVVLDKIEGHPRYYTRRAITVNVEGVEYDAWMYFRDPQGKLVPTGDYNDAEQKDVVS